MHTLTHAAAKLLLLVKLPSLYKYIRFQRAIRAKSRRYMEESEGGEREGRRKGTGILYLVDKQTPPCRCSAVHGGAYFTFHSEKKFRPLNWIIKDCTTAKCARRVGERRQRRRRWPHGCLSVTWFRATGREAAELARKKRYVSPLIIFLNGSFPRKNAALSLSPRRPSPDAVSPPNADGRGPLARGRRRTTPRKRAAVMMTILSSSLSPVALMTTSCPKQGGIHPLPSLSRGLIGRATSFLGVRGSRGSSSKSPMRFSLNLFRKIWRVVRVSGALILPSLSLSIHRFKAITVVGFLCAAPNASGMKSPSPPKLTPDSERPDEIYTIAISRGSCKSPESWRIWQRRRRRRLCILDVSLALSHDLVGKGWLNRIRTG